MDTRLFLYQYQPNTTLVDGAVLRPFNPDQDLAALAALFNRCFPEWALTAERIEYYLLFGGEILRTWVVQYPDGRIVGTASAAISRNPHHPGGHIHWLAVDAGEREMGIGRCLVDRAVNYLIGLGFTKIWALLRPASEATVKIAQDFGGVEQEIQDEDSHSRI